MLIVTGISCQQNFFIDRLRYNIIKLIITKLILINKIYASFLSITPIIFNVGQATKKKKNKSFVSKIIRFPE
jgi:hypothetical protein